MRDRLPIPMNVTRIVLVGFMGAGKSTVGPLLARALGWEFADADQHIERQTGLTVAGIFERDGESGFRRLESEAFGELMQRPTHVVALGGGALEAASTVRLLEDAAGTYIVFLHAPLDTLMARCAPVEGGLGVASVPVRPVLSELLKDRAKLEQRLAARVPSYERAHLTVATDGLTPDEVAERILAEIGAERWPVAVLTARGTA